MTGAPAGGLCLARVLTRRRALDGGGLRGEYRWTQDASEVVLHMPVRPVCPSSAGGMQGCQASCLGRGAAVTVLSCTFLLTCVRLPMRHTEPSFPLSWQVPKFVVSGSVRVSLKGQRELDIAVNNGGVEIKRVGGVLRKAAKGFGSGSVWELVPDGDRKVWDNHTSLHAVVHACTCAVRGVCSCKPLHFYTSDAQYMCFGMLSCGCGGDLASHSKPLHLLLLQP